MPLLIPIKPEPASRIYSGRKWFELRKTPPPRTGFAYLYETQDETKTVSAIRGGIFFHSFLDLPLEELWETVGELATSRERFERYFGANRRNGIAIAIDRVEVFEKPVQISDLLKADPDFTMHSFPFTYMAFKENSKVARFLSRLPRKEVFEKKDSKLCREAMEKRKNPFWETRRVDPFSWP